MEPRVRAVIENARALFDSLSYVGDYVARGFVGENMFLASLVRERSNRRHTNHT